MQLVQWTYSLDFWNRKRLIAGQCYQYMLTFYECDDNGNFPALYEINSERSREPLMVEYFSIIA